MEKFSPKVNFTATDIKAYVDELKKEDSMLLNKQLNLIAVKIDELITNKVRSYTNNDLVIGSSSVSFKIELKYYEGLKKLYESRGFSVSRNDIITGTETVNMGDFYDTEFHTYDYYINISWDI